MADPTPNGAAMTPQAATHTPKPPPHAAPPPFEALLDALIRQGDHIETTRGPLPVPPGPAAALAAPAGAATPPWHAARLRDHEKTLLAAVLCGPEDQSARWGLFRRRIGLRFDQPVPSGLWSSPSLRLIAAEIDAIVRGQRDVRSVNADAIRHGLRERGSAGRWGGDLQELELTLADLLSWGRSASALDFPIACDIFQSAKARQLFYPALRSLLAREQQDVAIEQELQSCRSVLNEALALTAGRCREHQPVLHAGEQAAEHVALAALPADQRPTPISTGIPSLDLDMRGGIIPGQGESTWVLAARSGVGKTCLAIAAAMGLACNGAAVLVFSCELSRRAIGARLLAHYCRRAYGSATHLFSSNDLEGRGRVIDGADLQQLRHWQQAFSAGRRPDGQPMGALYYQSAFAATVEEFCALVEDTKAAHPQLAVVVLDHFHAMGISPGYGSNSTAELAARAMALKALAGRCELDLLVVGQLNRGAYGSTTPDVSHLAGTSELERYASAVWLLERPRVEPGAPPQRGLLELHHGKFRHGQPLGSELSRTMLRLDRAHCFLEADEAQLAFSGRHLYPGLEAL